MFIVYNRLPVGAYSTKVRLLIRRLIKLIGMLCVAIVIIAVLMACIAVIVMIMLVVVVLRLMVRWILIEMWYVHYGRLGLLDYVMMHFRRSRCGEVIICLNDGVMAICTDRRRRGSSRRCAMS